ncbi:MAG TPA: Re/Si-specific NAD(P)(+) transhydrogenase subunit alpha [Rhodospirillaceae bacterium]|nr:MAG: NAD(P) transhydrogenase subunit alpha [Alphaproteobacteria bacterium GWF2_58_20]HAU29955.1 Re/Si-specific NAD(P)(+) transhydrogenase subunit alpha [Rhodospirillaceae bacterium]
MKITVLKENLPGEMRVAATPETVKKLIALGAEVLVEADAGIGASIPDSEYDKAGASVSEDRNALLADANIVLCVQRPEAEAVKAMKKDALLIGMLAPHSAGDFMTACAKAHVTAMAMEFVPRITRAQAMDVLSSQANLAGYRAVIEAACAFGRAFPMMMTAAGTITPARVLILGAGVAGLQAIATARRLGAIVSAFDVRAAAKEQVESLGASFVEVEGAGNLETKGGYAKEADEDYKRRQAVKIHETLAKTDIAITTALIPGKPAPVLITEDMVKAMKPGSVIVDMAVAQGGNCPLSRAGQNVVVHDVTIIGHENLPSRIAADAAALYARNLLSFISLMKDKESGAITADFDDEILTATTLTRGGKIVHPAFADAAKKPHASKKKGS